MDPQRLVPGDATLVENIVSYLKAKGIFDDFRHECLADVDTKSSWQNLSQRVDGYTSKFLSSETWHPDLNKNELRNKLRQNISESWLLKVGADHVVEQVINPKIHQYFLPKIIEVVHQYIKEQNELSSKKFETTSTDSASISDRAVYENADSKAKTSISDPIADILSFGYSKSKSAPSTSTHVKNENVLQKPTDLPRLEKKKEEKMNSVFEKSGPEMPSEATTSTTFETKSFDKEREKIKKEEPENSQEASKKVVKEEIKIEKKKIDDTKLQSSEISCSVEENKASKDSSVKPSVSEKKDNDKIKQKIKSSNMQKSSNSSYEVKKYKKESSDKPSDKHTKNKSTKSLKESTSPTKNTSCTKSVSKEEKFGESSKSKSSDSSSSKTSESSTKKFSKSNNSKKDSSSKHKAQGEKIGKLKSSKSTEKSDPHDSSNSEKGMKTIQYSSSYDSSQGSDQDKSSSSSSKKERPKHFSKFAKKDKSEHSDKSDKSASDKKRSKDVDEDFAKKQKHEKISKLEKLKDSTVAAKISSRSNSFGSTSSVSSSSNTSKDNLVSNSDEVSESSVKDKKKKQVKEKDSCQNSDVTLPPPPPPPPTSGSLSCELTSSAEMSSMEDTQSSSEGEISSSEDVSEDPLSDLESESKEFKQSTLNESHLNSITEEQNSFLEKIFLSSSSSEFEGFESSPEKMPVYDSDVSVSSVHTSDLSSFDDELSDDDLSLNYMGVKKRLTLKEAEELIQNRAYILENCKTSENQSKSTIASLSEEGTHSSSSFLSSLESSPEKNKRDETMSQDSDVTVSSVHTSDLSSFDDELSDEEFCLKNLGVKKRLTLKEAQELIQSKAISLNKRKKSPKEKKPESSKNSPNANEPDSSKIMATHVRSGSVSTSFKEKSSEKSSFLSSDEESSPSEPKRSLRRERKLNPRYASSEYTSIFNSRKESFITKQSSPSGKIQSVNSSPNAESKNMKKESSSEKTPKKKSPRRNLVEAAGCQNEVEHSEKTKNMLHRSKLQEEEKDFSNNSDMLSSEEIDSIMDKEHVFEINTKPADNSEMKIHLKLKLQNNSNLNRNSLKRKLAITESTPVKRPCSRNSVDSSSSELVPNENKPFNNEKQSLVDDKILRDSNMKGSDFTDGIKKDLFCKQRTNNNGDVLGQKDIFPKNSHGKNPHSNSAEKKTTESDTSKELNAL